MTRWLAAVLLAAFEALFFGLAAQADYCSRPNKPFIVSGYTSDRSSMQSTKDDVERYARRMREYVECLGRESKDAEDEVRRVMREWNDAAASYNRR